jgi:hypothetical protein
MNVNISPQSTGPGTGRQTACQGQKQGRRFDNFAQRLTAGLPGAKGNPAAAAPASRKPQTTSATTPKPAKAAVSPEAARAAAMQSERERWAAVMASEHANGREKGCRRLLSAPQHWPAAQIIRNLQQMPTDQQIIAEESRKQSDAVWDRARSNADALSGLHDADGRKSSMTGNHNAAVETSTQCEADAVWDRAWAARNSAIVNPLTGAASSTEVVTASTEDVWSKAYRSAAR